MPAQQSASVAHVAERAAQAHCPPRQTRPAQQSPSAAQACPRSEQPHWPPLHVRRSQQSPLVVQVKLRSLQAAHRPFVQREPAQQPPAAAQKSPAFPHDGAHRPAWQANPEQQGPSAQEAPMPPQPDWQVIGPTEASGDGRQARLPQHWLLPVQLSPSRLQRGGPHRPPSQPPAQQSPPEPHVLPLARQPLAQAPSRHARPAQHSESLLQ